MKQFIPALIMAMLSLALLAGCKSESATFSNADGDFVLSANGTYMQSFPQDTTRNDQKEKDDPFASAPNTGTWSLIGPSDGPGSSGYKVELSGVRPCHSRWLAEGYTLVLSADSIHDFDKLLGKQKSKSLTSAP